MTVVLEIRRRRTLTELSKRVAELERRVADLERQRPRIMRYPVGHTPAGPTDGL